VYINPKKLELPGGLWGFVAKIFIWLLPWGIASLLLSFISQEANRDSLVAIGPIAVTPWAVLLGYVFTSVITLFFITREKLRLDIEITSCKLKPEDELKLRLQALARQKKQLLGIIAVRTVLYLIVIVSAPFEGAAWWVFIGMMIIDFGVLLEDRREWRSTDRLPWIYRFMK